MPDPDVPRAVGSRPVPDTGDDDALAAAVHGALGGDPDGLRTLLGGTAARAAGVGTFAWDLRSGMVAVDHALRRLVGLDGDEPDGTAPDGDEPDGAAPDTTASDGASVLAAATLAHRLHPHDRARIAQALLRGRDEGQDVTVECRVVVGTPRWLLAHARLVRDAGDAVVGVVGSAIDTTSLAQAEARTTRLLETMPTALFLLDHRWRFTYVDAEAERLLGYTREAALGRDMWALYPEALGTVWEERYREAVATGRPVVFDVHLPGPPERWLEVRAWPGPDGLAVYLLDATATRRATHALEHAARRGSLLAEITADLAASADPEAAVRALADRVVPELADWAIVTLVEEDGGGRWPVLRDVGTRHADPGRQPLAERYAQVRLQQLAAGSFVEQTLATGSPVHVSQDATAQVRAVLQPGEARDLLDELAPHSAALLPLRARGRTLGLLTLFSHEDRPPLDADELRLAEEISARAGLALDNARLRERQGRLAERLQRSMLTEPVRADDLRVAVRYVPSAEAAQVGGDWYDAFRDADGSTLVVIGDVVGHDNEAVAAMGQLRSLLRGIAVSTGPGTGAATPATLLSSLDRAIEVLETDAMASLVVARLEGTGAGDHVLSWSNAGHPPPMLLTPDGDVDVLVAEHRDLFVGVTAETARTDSAVVVPPGTRVLLYTDGLVERRDRPARDGVEDLREVLADLVHLDLEDLCDAVLARLVPGRAQDDVALLAVEVGPRDPRRDAAPDERRPATLGAWRPGSRGGTGGAAMPEDQTASLVVDPGAPLSEARIWATERTQALGGGPDVLGLVALLTSEVVSNATRHGDGRAVLEVTGVDGGVRVGVTDDGDGLPEVRHPDASTPGGRGVWLVSELARSWGVDRLPGGGKRVWFEVGFATSGTRASDDDGAPAGGQGASSGGRDTAAAAPATVATGAGTGAGPSPTALRVEIGSGPDDPAVLVLSGDVDADRHDELRARVTEVLASGRPVVVRCEELAFVDSTGLAALSRLATAASAPPRVVGAPPQLRRMLHVTGLEALVRLD
ncbi:MAG: SpoIIE family protein phosphatase [Actinotalea sp.]|nr:SpoIIE family protein phosphatase [Actinotalea sp.]